MKKLIGITISVIIAMCCFSCTDDIGGPRNIIMPWDSARSYIQDGDGNTLYTYCAKPYYDDGVATLSIGETYIVKVAYCYMGRDEVSKEWHDAWIEDYNENCLQIIRRYDIEEIEEIGKYFELTPIGEPIKTSFVIRYGERGDEKYAFGKKVEVNIVE